MFMKKSKIKKKYHYIHHLMHMTLNFFNNDFLEKNLKCDLILDDGPHALRSIEQFLKLYSQIMTDDGILIIQDIHFDLMSFIGSCRNKR
jgi:hypothetical protein